MKPLWCNGGLLIGMLLIAACRGERVVKVAWDVPAKAPDHYRLLVDGREVKAFAPPEIDSTCHCMIVQVSVEAGSHALRVEACDRANACSSSAEVRMP
jgi:hypothetical protein